MRYRQQNVGTTKKSKKRTDMFVRELGVDDAPLYVKIAHDEQISMYTSFFFADTTDAAKKCIRSNTTQYCRIYGLFTKANRLVGVYTVEDDALGGATVCYMIGERYRGQGYASKGIRLLAEVYSAVYQYFSFSIRKSNLASIRVQECLGSELVEETSKHLFYKFRLRI